MKKRKTPEEEQAERLEKLRKLSIRLQKKKEKEERVARYRKKVYNYTIQKKADELNKIMAGRDVKNVQHSEHWWTVYFKNGQVFNFTFLPPHITGDRKIIPILE